MNGKSYPKPGRDQAPKENQDAVSEVDNQPAVFMQDGMVDVAGHAFGAHEHRIASAAQQVGIDEARTDIRNPNGEMLQVCQLSKRFQVAILETFCG